MATECNHRNLYSVPAASRCEFVKNFCGSDYTSFDFSRLAYCDMQERLYLIIPLFVVASHPAAAALPPRAAFGVHL